MAAIAAALRSLGLEPVTGVAETGLICEIPGVDGAGPRIALRADTDALPILERTGLPYASTRHDVMHACGHDAHLSMLVGAAALLVAEPPAEQHQVGLELFMFKDRGCLQG